MSGAPEDLLEQARIALLALAQERPWRHIALRDVAERAGIPLTSLYAQAPSKLDLLARLSAHYDTVAMGASVGDSEDMHDRLFDSVMARVEAMEPDRAALTAMARETPRLAIASHLPLTARAILETAGLEATPPRIAAMAALWARVVQVWRDDDGALNRTMAEIDQRLKQMRSALGRIGAGF